MNKIEVDNFPTWRRYLQLFREGKLSQKALGALYLAMMEYQFEGTEPEKLPADAKVWWLFIKKDLDYARQKYESSVINGRKGGRKKKEPKETQDNPMEGKTESESKSESQPESKPESEAKSTTKTDQGVPAKADGSVSKRVYGEYGWVLLSDQDYDRLKSEMGEQQLQRCIAYIDESAQSTGNRNHWFNWSAVIKRCYQNGWHEASSFRSKKDIPYGATGELGEAELEAIQRVLST